MRMLFFGFIICMTLAFFSVVITHAFFANSATSDENSFSAAAEFPASLTPTSTLSPSPTLTPTPGDGNPSPPVSNHVLINEVSPVGSSSADWVELYNPTISPIDVGGWIISDSTTQDDVLPSAIIPAGAYAIVVNNASVVSIPVGVIKIMISANGIGNGMNDSLGDLIELKNGTTVIDAVNYGNETAYFSGGPAIPVAGKTISRIPNGTDTDMGSDWQTNTNSTIGGTN